MATQVIKKQLGTQQGVFDDRMRLAEKYYQKRNNGASLPSQAKVMLAQVLANTAKCFKMNEAFENSVSGTQRSDMGNFKKFALDITSLVLPNLIAPRFWVTI